MERIYFQAQLCIHISNFKEISSIDIQIILCLGTSLNCTVNSRECEMFNKYLKAPVPCET